MPKTIAVDSGPMVRVWPGHNLLPCRQVSSYGGTLRYELHSEAQRGDVFIPTESRPDVVLQVADGVDVVGWAGGRSQAGWRAARCQPSSAHTPPQGNQMSITFLEPMYPVPGHVHHGRLQLVEVSGAGLGTRVPLGARHSPWGPKGPKAAVPAL